MKTVAVVGGGAAGLAAGIAAAETLYEAGASAQVAIYEKDDRVGRSILATGNGRCNFSNAVIEASLYHNAAFVGAVLDGVSNKLVMEFFEDWGLAWREEGDGRRYPLANKASVVVDVLRFAARRYGVIEACGKPVKAIDPPRAEGKRFTLRMQDGVLERADAVIVACGGRALEGLDLPFVTRLPMRPVLGSLRVADEQRALVRELDNIRVRCGVTLVRNRGNRDEQVGFESGELMFRKYGVSGICVFNLSRLYQPNDRLLIDFLQMGDRSEAGAYLCKRLAALNRRLDTDPTCEDVLRGLVLPRLGDVVFKVAGIDGGCACDKRMALDLAGWLSAFPLTVCGIGDEGTCQVRRGGLAVDQFNPLTMGAHAIEGLFAAGEALDVDGPCGGYNLHWAWTTGLVAGRNAALHVL